MAEFVSPHWHLVPKNLIKEMEKIGKEVEQGLDFPLPPIVIKMDCSFAKKPRHFAAQQGLVPCTVHLCPDLAEQPITRIRGILYHEFGHIVQNLEDMIKGRVDTEDRDYEQDCDYKIEAVTGVRIYYDDDLLQRAGPGARGKPRPKGLT